MRRIRPECVMLEIWNVYFYNSSWRGYSIKLSHDKFEFVKCLSNMFKYMFHQYIIKTAIFEWPRSSLHVEQDIRFTLRKAVGIDEVRTLIKAAPQV